MDRASEDAPYSYDWIDNRGRRSPQELAGLPEPRVGDRFMARRQLLNLKNLAERRYRQGTVRI